MRAKAPAERYHRTPRASAPPFGYDDLPTRLEGSITLDLERRFTPHASAYDAGRLEQPWRGERAHPRLVIARAIFGEPLELELGLRAAHELVDPFATVNALSRAHRRPFSERSRRR